MHDNKLASVSNNAGACMQMCKAAHQAELSEAWMRLAVDLCHSFPDKAQSWCILADAAAENRHFKLAMAAYQQCCNMTQEAKVQKYCIQVRLQLLSVPIAQVCAWAAYKTAQPSKCITSALPRLVSPLGAANLCASKAECANNNFCMCLMLHTSHVTDMAYLSCRATCSDGVHLCQVACLAACKTGRPSCASAGHCGEV